MNETAKPGLSSSAKVILLCTILLVVFLSGAMIFMFRYLEDLSISPLTYGARKIAQTNQADDLMCTCQLVGVADKSLYPFQDPIFYFNTTTFWDQTSYKNGNLHSLQGLKINGSSG